MDDMYVDESLTETNPVLYECDECGEVRLFPYGSCPRCGGDMKEKE